MENNTTALVPTNLNFLNDIHTNLIEATISKIQAIQKILQKTMVEGRDYGTIKGCGNKKNLLKPGAEKVIMLLGITSEYDVVEKIEDYDKGFFAYTVKCLFTKNGLKITEGLGHCNTKEKRYTNQDGFTLANTVLKMAKKRSQVDAALTVASLSEAFTQDLEDEDEKPQQKNNSYNNNYQANKNQEDEKKKLVGYMFGWLKKLKITEQSEQLLYISGIVGKEIKSTKDLTTKQLEEIILTAKKNTEEQAVSEKPQPPQEEQEDVADMFEKETGGARND